METDQSSTEKLREEILADARREAEVIVIRAKQDAEALLKDSAAEADRLRKERLNFAQIEAARQKDLIMATVSVEFERRRAARIEALLESVYEEVRQCLLDREGFEYREVVIALAADAIKQMEGGTFVVKLSDADLATLGDNLADDIAQKVGRSVNITISNEQGISEGGVLVEDGETRQVWDNRFLKRLERMWPELRRQIAVKGAFIPKTGSGGDNP